MKYKVNDICEVLNKGECGTFEACGSAKYIKITEVSKGSYYAYDILDKNMLMLDECACCFEDEHLKPYKTSKPIKAPKVNFLLKYDLDVDPVEEFETLAQVKKRIQELAKCSNLKRNSLIVYAVKSRKPVELVDKVQIKGI